ncbi:MAG: FISUMP domain-containing protein, partial [Minisyncoccia bacterium]
MRREVFLKKFDFKKPLMILGFVVLLTAFIFGVYRLSDFFNLSNLTNKSVIKNFTVRQLPSRPGEPIKWVKTISINQVNSLEHLLAVPSVANNIKISNTSLSVILTKTRNTKDNSLSNIDRKKLSELSTKASQSEASLALAESIKQNNQTPQRFFSLVTKIFSKVGPMFAEVGDAVNSPETFIPDMTLIDLTASSSPIADQITTVPEEQVVTEIEIPISTSTDASTTETPISTSTEILSASEISVDSEVSTSSSIIPVLFVKEGDTGIQSTSSIATTSESTPTTTPSDPQGETLLVTSIATSTDFVSVEYETPAPVIAETNTDTGKTVTISAEDTLDVPITNVLAYTNIPKIYKLGQENKIKIKWANNDGQVMPFQAYDLNSDGYIDYLEWTVPHLSVQTFEIIFISKAFQLDQDQTIVADIYDQVQTLDNNYTTIPDANYIRATFYQTLDNTKDITVYAKPTDSNTLGSIEVFPVYIDAGGNQTEGPQLTTISDGTNPDFSNIDHSGKYRVLLSNLQTPTDIFDLKFTGSIDVDYVVDPDNVAPNAPTLISPASASYTSNNKPTLSANYSDPDIGDTGTTNYRIATSSANCLAGTTLVSSGTSSETSTNNATTTYTPASTIGSNGIYYWCSQNNDGIATSSWTSMGNFILDTTSPSVAVCGSSLLDNRDAKSYSTVYIATSSQCWMSQNLNAGTKIPSCVNGYVGVCTSGGSTPSIQGTSTTNIKKYCYSDNEVNCDLYGGLYEQDQAMGGSLVSGATGICPVGWHLPSDNEYMSLEMALGMTQTQASSTGWRGTHSEGDQLKKIVTPSKCAGTTPPCGISGWQAIM